MISDHIVSYCDLSQLSQLSQQSLLRMQTIDEICNYFRAQNSMPVNKVIQLANKLSQKYFSLIPFTIKCFSNVLESNEVKN
jgi:hypothetical protein